MWAQLKNEVRFHALPLTVGLLAMVGSSISNQALPRVMGRLIDSNMNANQSNSNKGIVLMVIVGGSIASCVRTIVLKSTRQRIASRLRQQGFAAVLRKDLLWFHQDCDHEAKPHSNIIMERINTSPSSIATILRDDVEQIASMLTETLADCLRSGSAVVLSMYQMFLIDPLLLAVSVSIIPSIGAFAMLGRKMAQKLELKQRRLNDSVSDFCSERLENIRIVQLCHRADDEITNYQVQQHQLLHINQKVAFQSGLLMAFMFGASSLGLLTTVQYGTSRIHQGRITSGQLTSFTTYSFLLGLGTAGIVKGLSEMNSSLVAASRFYLLSSNLTIYDEKPTAKENESSTTTTTATATLEKALEDDLSSISWLALESVSFRYPTPPMALRDQIGNETQIAGTSPENPWVLNDISLVIDRGTVTALVGPNGCGKSTLVNVLAGLFPPTQVMSNDTSVAPCSPGRVVVSSGRELSSFSHRQRAHLIQVVPQSHSSGLLDLSIRDNVKYSRSDASDEEVRIALLRAGFILDGDNNNEACAPCALSSSGVGIGGSLGFDLDSRVGRGGCKLSGGQAQRIALARAFLARPLVLILDEPAVHLDTHGEQALTQAILKDRRTHYSQSLSSLRDMSDLKREYGDVDNNLRQAILMITHNPKSLEFVDRILVMKEGAIVESGTLSELRHAKSHLVSIMPDLLIGIEPDDVT